MNFQGDLMNVPEAQEKNSSGKGGIHFLRENVRRLPPGLITLKKYLNAEIIEMQSLRVFHG